MRCSIALVLAILLSAPAAARAQATPAKKRHAPAWIAIGAASGFGVGLWAGLTSFDQSIDSDRKIWTTALVSAAGGGVLAYLLTRRRTDRTGAAPGSGATGAWGAMGATGAGSATGAWGAIGATGAWGASGPTGANGVSYLQHPAHPWHLSHPSHSSHLPPVVLFRPQPDDRRDARRSGSRQISGDQGDCSQQDRGADERRRVVWFEAEQ